MTATPICSCGRIDVHPHSLPEVYLEALAKRSITKVEWRHAPSWVECCINNAPVTADEYRVYLSRFPNGYHADAARGRIEELEAEQR